MQSIVLLASMCALCRRIPAFAYVSRGAMGQCLAIGLRFQLQRINSKSAADYKGSGGSVGWLPFLGPGLALRVVVARRLLLGPLGGLQRPSPRSMSGLPARPPLLAVCVRPGASLSRLLPGPSLAPQWPLARPRLHSYALLLIQRKRHPMGLGVGRARMFRVGAAAHPDYIPAWRGGGGGVGAGVRAGVPLEVEEHVSCWGQILFQRGAGLCSPYLLRERLGRWCSRYLCRLAVATAARATMPAEMAARSALRAESEGSGA